MPEKPTKADLEKQVRKLTEDPARSGESSPGKPGWIDFAEVVRTMNAGVCAHDAEGRITYVNDQFIDFMRGGRDELIGRYILEMVPPERKEAVVRQFEVRKSGESTSYETELLDGEGRRLLVLIASRPVFDGAGGFRGAVSVITDISKQVEARKALAETERRYRDLLENASQAIIIIQDGQTKLANRACMELSGYTDEDILTVPFADFIHPEDRAMALTRHVKRLAGENVPSTYAIRVIDKQGNLRWVELHSVRIDWEGRPAILAFLTEITRRLEIEEALRSSEESYAELVRNSPAAIVELDMRRDRFISANAVACSYTGYSRDELLALPGSEVFGGPSREQHRQRNEAVLRGEEVPLIWEYQIKRKDGSMIWVLINMNILHDGEGRPAIARVVANDITQQKLSQELVVIQKDLALALAGTSDTMEAFQLILKSAMQISGIDCGGIYLVDPAGGDLRLAASAGLSPGFAAAVSHRLADRPFARAVSKGKVLYTGAGGIQPPAEPLREKEGILSLLSLPVLDQGRVVAVLNLCSRTSTEIPGFVRDSLEALTVQISGVLRRLRAENELKASEEKYRFLVENASDAICIVQDGVVKFPNPVSIRVTGYTLEELDGMPFLNLLHPEDREMATERHQRRLMGGMDGATRDYRFLTKDGNTILVQLNGAAITWEGRPAVIVFARDVTANRRMEEELESAKRMEAVGTLAGGIAHDFNNLLMAVQGNVSLMQLSTPKGHPHRHKLANIESCVRSGTSLTRQLLGYAKGGKYEVAVGDASVIVSEAADMFARARKEIRLYRLFHTEVCPVEVDQGQIEQVLLNLFVNAWHAMPGGGDLFLETGFQDLEGDGAEALGLTPGTYVRITVTDTGAGMDEETRKRVFEPFFTTRKQGAGAGLGLASSYGIIQNHNGAITVESAPGRGSTFTIYLPKASGLPPESLPESEGMITGQGTILAVDDEESVLEVAAGMLEELGYTVLSADGGEKAVELYGDNLGAVDMVLLDMIMPGISGAETYRILKRINPRVRVLLSSGYSCDRQARELLQAGCAGFIQKPFDIKALGHKIQAVMNPGSAVADLHES